MAKELWLRFLGSHGDGGPWLADVRGRAHAARRAKLPGSAAAILRALLHKVCRMPHCRAARGCTRTLTCWDSTRRRARHTVGRACRTGCAWRRRCASQAPKGLLEWAMELVEPVEELRVIDR
eukprot:5999764-Prymnesium_polylepis.1